MNGCMSFSFPTRHLLTLPPALKNKHPEVKAFGNTIIQNVVTKTYFGILLYTEECAVRPHTVMLQLKELTSRAQLAAARATALKENKSHGISQLDIPINAVGYSCPPNVSRETAHASLFELDPVNFVLAVAIANGQIAQLGLRFIIDLEPDEYRYIELPLNDLIEPNVPALERVPTFPLLPPEEANPNKSSSSSSQSPASCELVGADTLVDFNTYISETPDQQEESYVCVDQSAMDGFILEQFV